MLYYTKIFFLILALVVHAIFAGIGKVLFFFHGCFCIMYIARINKILGIILCFILGFHIKKPKGKINYNRPVLYVGNHLSYLDVAIIASCYPTIFVTSADMGEKKSEGWITANAGSVYVERRRNKLNLDILKKNINSMKSIIEKKGALCIFPEATSANGGKLVFFSSLFASVEYSRTTIVPFAIKYISINGVSVTNENESIIYFYRGQRFIPHIKKLLKYGNIKAEITILPEFSAIDKDRKEICNLCKEVIMKKLI